MVRLSVGQLFHWYVGRGQHLQAPPVTHSEPDSVPASLSLSRPARPWIRPNNTLQWQLCTSELRERQDPLFRTIPVARASMLKTDRRYRIRTRLACKLDLAEQQLLADRMSPGRIQ